MEDVVIFAARLRELRESRRISRRVASELCGFDAGAFRRYERGEREPSARALCAIAEEFGVSMDYLWGREENNF